MHCPCVLSHFSRVQLFATPWTIAHQAPLSTGFSRQAYWSGLPCPPPGDRPDPEIKSMSLVSPPLAGGFLPLTAPVKPLLALYYLIYFVYQTCKATTCLLYYKTKVRQLKTFMYSFILK